MSKPTKRLINPIGFANLVRSWKQNLKAKRSIDKVLLRPVPWNLDLCPNCLSLYSCKGPHIPKGWGRRHPRLYSVLHSLGILP